MQRPALYRHLPRPTLHRGPLLLARRGCIPIEPGGRQPRLDLRAALAKTFELLTVDMSQLKRTITIVPDVVPQPLQVGSQLGAVPARGTCFIFTISSFFALAIARLRAASNSSRQHAYGLRSCSRGSSRWRNGDHQIAGRLDLATTIDLLRGARALARSRAHAPRAIVGLMICASPPTKACKDAI